MSTNTTFNDTDQFPDQHVLAGEYSDQLGVIHNLMPYPHYGDNPWEALRDLRDFLDGLPETCSTWQFRELDGYGRDWWQTQRRRTYALACGAWVMGRNSGKPRYVNPEYIHRKKLEWTPTQDRCTHAREVATFGLFSLSDIGSRFNCTRGGFHRYLQRHSVPWGELRAEGKRRMANTVRCTVEWTDWERKDCAAVLGVPESTLGDWCRDRADVDVPPDPATHARGRKWG